MKNERKVLILNSEGVGAIKEGARLISAFNKLEMIGTHFYDGMPRHPLTIGLDREGRFYMLKYPDVVWELLRVMDKKIIIRSTEKTQDDIDALTTPDGWFTRLQERTKNG